MFRGLNSSPRANAQMEYSRENMQEIFYVTLKSLQINLSNRKF